MNRYNFPSRTRKSIRKIASEALEARVRGHNHVIRGVGMLSKTGGSRELTRELIASLNYSLNQAQKELDFRANK